MPPCRATRRTSATGTALPALLGVVLLAVGLTVLGYGLGLLIRNSPAAICILLLWPLIAEGLIAGLLSAAGAEGAVKFLPYSAGFNMALTEPDPDAFGRVGGGAVLLRLGDRDRRARRRHAPAGATPDGRAPAISGRAARGGRAG